MIIAFFLFFTIYGVTNYYIGRKVFLWLQLLFPNMNSLIFSGIFIFCALTPLISTVGSKFSMNNPLTSLSSFIQYLGSQWMGIYMYLFLFSLLVDIALLVANLFNVISTPLSINIKFFSGLIVLLSTFAVFAYGNFNARNIKNISYEVNLEKSQYANGLNIVLISDLHLGSMNDASYVEKMVKNINELSPDLVCISGDIFDSSYTSLKDPEKAIELFKKINSTYGVYACLGNHDAGRDFPLMVSFLEKSNVVLLRDEGVVIDDKIVLIGRRDSSPIGNQGESRSTIDNVLTEVPSSLPVIVLDHNPINIPEYGKEVDLTLCGHTHKGQVFPGNFITNSIFKVDYGHYKGDKNSPQVIVTSGAATWGPPIRIGSYSEIVKILIKSPETT